MLPTAPLWDSNIFNKTIKVVGIHIPSSKTSTYLKVIGPRIFRQHRYKPVRTISETMRLVLLDPKSLPTTQSVMAVQPLADMIAADSAEVKEEDIQLSYEYYDLDDALRVLLPPETPEIVSSFEAAGHLVHVNLKSWLLPYKYIIGQVILDKTTGVRTVMNKTDTITNQFRVFPMELIAGVDDTNVEVSESGCRFRFDYARVYWNSKLQAEHKRLVQIIQKRPKAIVADMFAGVGPFSIPLAKSHATVYANDLNPDSYKYLVENARANKISPQRHIASNLDGRQFLADLVKKGVRPTDVIMNLPASATDFLDLFKGLYLDTDTKTTLPTVHCYTFEMEENAETSLLQRVEAMLGVTLPEKMIIYNVRNVAPKKHMYCLSFSLPESIERKSNASDPSAELPPDSKRSKML